MFEKQLFIKSVHDLKDIPETRLPEIILCGRSNFGKSSFINSFFNRKDLAKISSTPGKTRSLNYYLIDDKFYIVDLPGFGYAKASIQERIKWGKLVSQFINSSTSINAAIHFIDSRHKPTELDYQLNMLLKENKLVYFVILTKADKLKQSEIKPSKKNVLEAFPELEYGENLFIYSSLKKTGKNDVVKKISSLIY